MVKLELSNAAEKQLKPLAELNGSRNIEDYLTDKILLMLVDDITKGDIENSQKQIKQIQDNLNTKRNEVMLELKGEN